MGSSNFLQGSVNKGPMKISSSSKILRDPTGFLVVRDPKDRDLGVMKDVISDQQYKIDALLNTEKDLVEELDNREKLIQILQLENSKHIQEKNELKEKNRLALNDVAALAKKMIELEEQLKQRSAFEHQIIKKLETVVNEKAEKSKEFICDS